MSPAFEKPNIIRRIVKLKQLLKRWRTFASSNRILPDVPSGHIAVYVGARSKRYVVRISYLNHPIFSNLLQQAEEEFGFVNKGPLIIPCDESDFEEALISVMSGSGSSRWSRMRTRCASGQESQWLGEVHLLR